MSESLGSKAKVRWDRPKDRLNPERTGKQLAGIAAQVIEVSKLWVEAIEAGAYPKRGDGPFRPPNGASDPTSQAALSPTQRQMRRKAERASVLIDQAVDRLEDAARVLYQGFLLTDEEAWEEHNEKRQAATQEG